MLHQFAHFLATLDESSHRVGKSGPEKGAETAAEEEERKQAARTTVATPRDATPQVAGTKTGTPRGTIPQAANLVSYDGRSMQELRQLCKEKGVIPARGKAETIARLLAQAPAPEPHAPGTEPPPKPNTPPRTPAQKRKADGPSAMAKRPKKAKGIATKKGKTTTKEHKKKK